MLALFQNAIRGTTFPAIVSWAVDERCPLEPASSAVVDERGPGPSKTTSRGRRRMASALAGTSLLAVAALSMPGTVHAQPIPVELVVGNQYATTNLVISKPFTEASRLGYFHLSTIGIDYGDTKKGDLAIQNLLFYSVVDGIRVTGGAFHTERGFSPTVGMQFLRPGRDLFLLVAPRVNIESEPSYSVFSIVRYKPRLGESTRLYLGAQLLNTFEASRHIKSYQWVRVGVEVKGTQFGLAVNLDEHGPHPTVEFSVGFFVRREIF